jgi:hypothetical protein
LAETIPAAATPLRAEPGFAVSLLAAALPGLYLLMTSTTTLVTSMFPYDFKRMLQFALLLLLFLLPALNRRIRGELGAQVAAVPRWIGLTLLGIVAWGVLSAAVNARSAMHLANSLSEVALLTALVLAVFVVATCRRLAGRRFDQVAIGLLALTALAVGVQELVAVAAAHANGLNYSYETALQYFSKPRFYNQVQSWTVPVIVALPLLFSRYSLARWLCLIVLSLHWYVILMTAGRGTFVALVTTLTIALVFLPSIRKRLLQWQVAGLLCGAAVYAVILFSFETDFNETPTAALMQQGRSVSEQDAAIAENTTEAQDQQSQFLAESLGRPMMHTSGRSWIWSVTLRDALENPLLGIGPMNYACTSDVWFGHPHNFPLQIAAEWGLPIAFAVLTIVLLLLLRTSRAIRQGAISSFEDPILAGLLFTGVLAAAIHACFSGVMVMPASQVTGLIVCGTLLGLRAPLPEDRKIVSPIWLCICGLLLASSLLLLGAQELRTMEFRAAQLPARIVSPRIWQDAKVCQLYITQNAVTN